MYESSIKMKFESDDAVFKIRGKGSSGKPETDNGSSLWSKNPIIGHNIHVFQDNLYSIEDTPRDIKCYFLIVYDFLNLLNKECETPTSEVNASPTWRLGSALSKNRGINSTEALDKVSLFTI